jgi:hypothetical protein
LLDQLIDLLGENADIFARLSEGRHGGQRQATEQSHDGDVSPDRSRCANSRVRADRHGKLLNWAEGLGG